MKIKKKKPERNLSLYFFFKINNNYEYFELFNKSKGQ